MAMFRKYQHGCTKCFVELEDTRFLRCTACRAYHKEAQRHYSGYYDCHRIWCYDKLLAWLHQPRTVRQLVDLTGVRYRTVLKYVHLFCERGLITRIHTSRPFIYHVITKESTWRHYRPTLLSLRQSPNPTAN